jgi:hypothetical protein
MGFLRCQILWLFPLAFIAGCASRPPPGSVKEGNWNPISPEVTLRYLRTIGPVIGRYGPDDPLRVYRAMHLSEGTKIALHGDVISPYRRLFGSDDLGASVDYLRERVHGWSFDPAIVDPAPKGLYAANIGPIYWELAQIVPETRPTLEKAFGLPLETLRRGFFYVTPDDTSVRKSTGDVFGLLANTGPLIDFSALVHEARHSDCEALPPPEYYADLRKKKDRGDPNFLPPPGSDCFHLHTPCQIDGEASQCDQDFSGAYTFSYVILAELGNRCEGCMPMENFGIKYYALGILLHVKSLPESIRLRALEIREDFRNGLKNIPADPQGRVHAIDAKFDAILQAANAVILGAPEFHR